MKKNMFAISPYMIIAFLSLGVFVIVFNNADELWNYNFARNIYDGLSPYKDFNMVPTPLSAYVGALFLKIFGNEMFSLRILSALLMTLTFSFLFKLCLMISKSQFLSLVATLFMFALHLDSWIYNYNNLNLFLLVFVMYLEYRQLLKESRSQFVELLIGLLIGITPLIKQTTGIFLICANIFLKLFDMFPCKVKLHICKYRVWVSFVPSICYLLFLQATNALEDFFDYSIVGIKYFTHRYGINDFASEGIICVVLLLFPLVTGYLMLVQYLKDESIRKIIVTFSVLCLAGCVVAYPLCDYSHFVIAITPLVPCLFLGIRIKPVKDGQKIFCVFFAIMISVCCVYRFVPLSNEYKLCSLKHYSKLPIRKDFEKYIQEIDNFILEQEAKNIKVLITDKVAAMYMIPLDKYNKDFDLLLEGNVGSKSVEELLMAKENVLYLLPSKDVELEPQSHEELINYIRNNYYFKGEVFNYEIYCENK